MLWGLAVAGEAGVRRVLELLRVELTNALTLLGVGAPTELTRDQVDWGAVFAGYSSTVDWPGAAVWRPLATAFPAAKVILTVRDAESWYDSVDQTIFRMFGYGPPDERVAEAWRIVPGLAVFTAFHRQMIWARVAARVSETRPTASSVSRYQQIT